MGGQSVGGAAAGRVPGSWGHGEPSPVSWARGSAPCRGKWGESVMEEQGQQKDFFPLEQRIYHLVVLGVTVLNWVTVDKDQSVGRWFLVTGSPGLHPGPLPGVPFLSPRRSTPLLTPPLSSPQPPGWSESTSSPSQDATGLPVLLDLHSVCSICLSPTT